VWAAPAAEASAAFRSRGRRELFLPGEFTPSPVAYQRSRRLADAGRGAFCQQRAFAVTPNDNPGPGAYEVRAAPARRARSALPWEVAGPEPADGGPGQYNVAGSALRADGRRDSPFLSIAKREPERRPANPPPGSYEVRDAAAAGRILPVIHHARSEKGNDWVDHTKADLPAPDAYQTLRMEPGRGRTISRIGREDARGNGVAGPGAYEVVHAAIGSRSRNACASQVGRDALL
jgi:hypothetical protein